MRESFRTTPWPIVGWESFLEACGLCWAVRWGRNQTIRGRQLGTQG